jgi:hypothetical protein
VRGLYHFLGPIGSIVCQDKLGQGRPHLRYDPVDLGFRHLDDVLVGALTGITLSDS